MQCERYWDWLTDAALGGLAPRRERELNAHLAVCPNCRAALERERALLAAIHQGLAASVTAEPSPAFAARVRARIAEEQVRPRRWITWWMPVAAGALAASLAVAVWVARSQKPGVRSQESGVSSQRSGVGSQESEVSTQRSALRRQQSGSGSQKHNRGGRILAASERSSAAGPDLEILVPKGQSAAVMRLYNSLWASPQDSQTTVAEDGQEVAGGLKPQPLEIKPLEIPTLDAELKPLARPDAGPDETPATDDK